VLLVVVAFDNEAWTPALLWRFTISDSAVAEAGRNRLRCPDRSDRLKPNARAWPQRTRQHDPLAPCRLAQARLYNGIDELTLACYELRDGALGHDRATLDRARRDFAAIRTVMLEAIHILGFH
jgi:hypothetical protein